MNFLKILFALFIPGTFASNRDDFKAREGWGGNKGGVSEGPGTKRDDVDDEKIGGDGEIAPPPAKNKDGEPAAKVKPGSENIKSAEDLIKEAEERANQNQEEYSQDELVELLKADSKLETGKVFDVDGQKMSMTELAEYFKGVDADEVNLSYKGKRIPFEVFEETIVSLSDDDGDEDSITLVKKSVSKEEFEKLVPEAAKFYGVDLSKYPDADLKKLLERYLDLQEGSKVVNQRHQDNAKTKRELETLRQQIDADKQELNRQAAEIARDKESLENRKKRANEILALDADDELDDNKKTKILSKQARAEEDLEDFKEEEKKLAEKERDLQSFHIAVFVAENTAELQAAFPELRTKKNAEDIIDVYDNDGDYEDDDDLMRALRIRTALNEYAALSKEARKKTPITKFYSKLRLSLPELKTAQPVKTKDTKDESSKNNKQPKSRKLSMSELVARALQKQKNTPRNPGGGSSRRSNESISDKSTRDPNYAKKTGWKRDDSNTRVVDSDYDMEGAIKDHKQFLANRKK